MQGEWVVSDSSSNGTFINSAKIGLGNAAVLKVNDMLGLPQPDSVEAQFATTIE